MLIQEESLKGIKSEYIIYIKNESKVLSHKL